MWIRVLELSVVLALMKRHRNRRNLIKYKRKKSKEINFHLNIDVNKDKMYN